MMTSMTGTVTSLERDSRWLFAQWDAAMKVTGVSALSVIDDNQERG